MAVVAAALVVIPRSAMAEGAAHAPAATERVVIVTNRPSPLFGLVLVDTHLYSTHDFSHFRAISTPALPTEGGAVGGASGSFPTDTDGWLVTADKDYASGYLWHTSNGGVSWQLVRKVWSGCCGLGDVDFVTPSTGWLWSGNPASTGLTLTQTEDGGTSWQRVPGLTSTTLTPPVFSSPSQGFRVTTTIRPRPGAPISLKTPSYITSRLIVTDNDGKTWQGAVLPRPRRGTILLEDPTFFGHSGVEALVDIDRNKAGTGPVSVAFDVSRNAGGSWHEGPAVPTGTTGSVTFMSVTGRPQVSIPTARSWWVLAYRPRGHLILERTNDAGRQWVRAANRGLHVTTSAQTDGMTFRAISPTIAFAWVRRGLTTSGYVTFDGGTLWQPQTILHFPKR
jgi:hypothetical protein